MDPLTIALIGSTIIAGGSAVMSHMDANKARHAATGGGKMNKYEKKAFKLNLKEHKKAMKKYGGEAFKQYPKYTPEQFNLLKHLTSQAQQGASGQRQPGPQNWLQSMLQPMQTQQDRDNSPLMREFQQQIVPEISERFAGLGAMSSSSYRNALMGAGTDLESKLAQSRFQNLMGLSQLTMQSDPFHSIYRPPTIPGAPQQPSLQMQQQQPSAWAGAAQGIGSSLGEFAANKLFDKWGSQNPAAAGNFSGAGVNNQAPSMGWQNRNQAPAMGWLK